MYNDTISRVADGLFFYNMGEFVLCSLGGCIHCVVGVGMGGASEGWRMVLF